MIWLIFVFLTGAAVLAVLAPLAAKSASASDAATDKAFFDEQLAEIERERAEGLLDPADAEGARVEAARRLLRASETDGATAQPSNRKTRRRRGSRDAAARAGARHSAVSFASATPACPICRWPRGSRRRRLTRTSPPPSRGSRRISPSIPTTGAASKWWRLFICAMAATTTPYTPMSRRFACSGRPRPATPLSARRYVMAAQGEVTPDAPPRISTRRWRLDATHPMSRYYLGLGRRAGRRYGQGGRVVVETARRRARQRRLPRSRARADRKAERRGDQARKPAKPVNQAAKARPANRARPSPPCPWPISRRSSAPWSSACAGRLAQNGDDVEGWLKLLRAYGALSEPEKAKAALDDARKALAGKARRRSARRGAGGRTEYREVAGA